MNKFILFILILGILLAVTGYYSYQKNIYSKEILKLEILGQAEADLCQEIEYIVKYKNNGDVRLENPELIFEYPEHSIVEDGSLTERIGPDKLGGAIYPGEEKTFYFRARLLGEKGEAKIARAQLSYQPKNLKARYESATTFATVIKSVPLTFKFDLPSKVESGKKINFGLNYFSNIDFSLLNLGIKIEYPSEFEFQESSPQSLDSVEWELSPLNKAEGGRIKIQGLVRGKLGEQKIFKAKLGIWEQGEFVLLKETTKGVEIVEPSLCISQQINNNPQYTASLGDMLHYEIFFRNIGEQDMTDLVLIARLESKFLDFYSIKAPRGEFESGDNSIIWEARRVPELQFLESQKQGKVEFWIKVKPEYEMKSLADKNPIIKNKIYLSQTRKEFTTRINSKLTIEQKVLFEEEFFGNSGPLPPEAGKTTTYTVLWQIKNYYNDLKNVRVKSVLPDGVKLTGEIFPEEMKEKFVFDLESREVIWEVGELRAGEGCLIPFDPLAFQIALSPKQSQKSQILNLIQEAEIIAEDQWTGQTIKSVAPAVDTNF